MLQQRRHRLRRERRLKRQRLIRPLFERGRSDVRQVRSGPLVVRYRLASRDEAGVDTPLQVGFAVGRAIGHRPARNRIKRLLRESFRHSQHGLAQQLAGSPQTLTMMILFRGRMQRAGMAIAASLPQALERIAEQLADPASGET